MVGSVSYTLLTDTFPGELPSQCLNGCVYTVSDTSSPKFCFAKGDLPTECLSDVPGSGCNECEQGWEKNGANCYFWSTNKMNWTDAEDFCKKKGAHLASVTSSTINDYILEGKAIRNIPHLWVGGTDAEIEDVWKWTDGSAWEFTYWGSGEPNNFGPQCLVYHPSNTWDDRTCFWEDKFLCSQTRCQEGSPEEGRPLQETTVTSSSELTGDCKGESSYRQCNGKPNGTPCTKDCTDDDCAQSQCCNGCCKRGSVLASLGCTEK